MCVFVLTSVCMHTILYAAPCGASLGYQNVCNAKQDFTYYYYSVCVYGLVNTVLVCDRNIDHVERGDGPPEEDWRNEEVLNEAPEPRG